MRVVEFEPQRLTIYVPEGLLDRLAIRRIPGIKRGHMPLLPFHELHFRRWDERPESVCSVWVRVQINGRWRRAEMVIDGPEGQPR